VNQIISLAAVLSLVVLSGCSESQDSAEKTQAPANSTADPHAGMSGNIAPTGSGPSSMAEGNQGNVKQVLQAGGYTYVEVATTGKGDVWVATNKTDAKTGDNVAWKDGAVMTNFKSKILDREFSQVMFVSGLISPSQLPKAPPGVVGVVVSTETAGGYTYIEVDTEKGRQWLAVSARPVENGTRISWSGGAMMRNFHSKALNRDFDQILFVSQIKNIG
jgi:hypothetical protein